MPGIRRLHLCILGLTTCLTACSTFPELDAQTSVDVQTAAYPSLLPAEDLRAQASTGPIEPREQPILVQAEQIDNRANALRARATSLRGDVIDEEERDRLNDEITIEDEEV